ncbi:MAG: SdpI family protein [Actinomycetota bacterium]
MDYSAVYLALSVCSAVGLLIIAIAIPLAIGKIGRNHFYGFRTPRTLSSDEIWYPANRLAAVNLIFAGLFIWIAAIVLFFIKTQMPPQTVVIIMAVLTIAAIFFAVIKSFLSLRKL